MGGKTARMAQTSRMGESTDDDNSAIEANDLHWESYLGGYCEWEGNPDDVDEDRWSCEGDMSLSDWHNWWYSVSYTHLTLPTICSV